MHIVDEESVYISDPTYELARSVTFDAPDRLCARHNRGPAPLPQSQALKSAGCVELPEEQASGGNRARSALARVLERIGKGDRLVVVRIDRLARSLSHLLEMIEGLQAKGAFFRSIMDPIDMSRHRASSPCKSLAPRLSSSVR